jgi:fructose-bisphosphate aldolase class I
MKNILHQIAEKLVENGKGILAADESTATITKRFNQINLQSTPENRRNYREMLFRTKDAMENYISGVILYDETIRQDCQNGEKLVDLLAATNTMIGIKVDTGAKSLALFEGETVTEGLDGLRERLSEYAQLGASFAKWRAVISITDKTPTDFAIQTNAHALARYAALCQENEIVPIVEPEILMDDDKSKHTIERCYEVTSKTLDIVFGKLTEAGVDLKGIILKPNMVISGIYSPNQASGAEIAEQTLRCLKDHMPDIVPGACFLSGGQNDIHATRHLSIMNKIKDFDIKLSFSYGRALQHSALMAWGGKEENITKAQQAFRHRAHMNSLATKGEWSEHLEK